MKIKPDDPVKRLYFEMTFRSAWGSVVVIAIIILYILSLMDLTREQLKVVFGTLAFVGPGLFGVFTVLVRNNMAPIVKFLEGKAADAASLELAESRSLSVPLFITINAIVWFGMGGIIIAAVSLWRGVIEPHQGAYIVGSAFTGGAAAGIMGYYYAKAPLRDVLRILWSKTRVKSKPPFFMPLLTKLVFLFTMTLLLIMVYIGFLTLEKMRSVQADERAAARTREITALAGAAASLGENREAVESMLKAAGGDRVRYCLARPDAGLAAKCVDGSPMDPLILQSLTEGGDRIVRGDDGRIWEWRDLGGGVFVAGGFSGAESDFRLGLASFFAKFAAIVLLGVGMGLMVALDLSDPLKDLVRAASAVTASQSSRVESSPGSEDEAGIVARAFHQMADTLTDQLHRNQAMLESIQLTAGKLSGMSEKLMDGISSQAGANIQQASMADQAAVTCTEIESTTRQIAESALRAAEASEAALNVTREGGVSLELTVEQFSEIEEKVSMIAANVTRLGEQSRLIGGVVRIIGEINSQVNLLSLNASLEAAGAGAHGRRFGVVAQEVGTLAKRTAESTALIAQIVGSMEKSVSDLVSLANQGAETVKSGREGVAIMADSFDKILSISEEASRQAREISLMSSQQASAVGELSSSVTQVSQTAGDSSEDTRAIEKAAADLSGVVGMLKQMLGRG